MLAENKLKLDKITLIGYILIVLAITIGLISRISAVFQYVTKVIDNETIEREDQPFLETQTAYVYILD